jgi:uncharacterized repeat protein (TIGR01451 family)
LALFVALGLLITWLVGASPVAWARPGQQPAHQTVPTLPPTRLPEPTVRPTATPTAALPPPPLATPTAGAPAGADLRVGCRASVSMIMAGQTFQYLIEVANVGPAASESLTVRDPLPATLQLLELRASLGQARVANNAAIVEVASLPAGATLRIELAVRVRPDTPLGTVIENRVELEHAGQLSRSSAVLVPLPPAELPRTGGATVP